MKTVQDLINEERERRNPKYEDILVERTCGGRERFSLPANIKEQGEWLEFDTTCDIEKITGELPTTRHIKTRGRIFEYTELRM